MAWGHEVCEHELRDTLARCLPRLVVEAEMNAAIDAAHRGLLRHRPEAREMMRHVRQPARLVPCRLKDGIITAKRELKRSCGTGADAGHVAGIRRIRRRRNE